MRKVLIVGGGLTGVMAAFEAKRLGFRDVELHERSDRLGGVARARPAHGGEVRTGTIYFGPDSDPVRQLLEPHGVRFETFPNRFGSVSSGEGGAFVFTHDFGGPALPASRLDLVRPQDERLSSRLFAYPPEIAGPLRRYCDWHVGVSPETLHASAATPLAINRVIPIGVDAETLVSRKQSDPLYDEMYGVPRASWTRPLNRAASLPAGGFDTFYSTCHRALCDAGVRVVTESLMPPRAALATAPNEQILVWAANPLPLFKAAGLEVPKAPGKTFSSYVFDVKWTGQAPFYVQNFTASGSIFRVYLYRTGDKVRLTAECVAPTDEADLKAEIRSLMEGFGGERLVLGTQVALDVAPRWLCHTVDTVEKLKGLRAWAERRMGDAFVQAGWEQYGKNAKHDAVRLGLERAAEIAQLRATGT